MTPARFGAPSVVTSSGSSWTASIRTRTFVRRRYSRRADTRMSITWPCSSTARYPRRHTLATFTYVPSTNQRTPAVCRARAGGLDGQITPLHKKAENPDL